MIKLFDEIPYLETEELLIRQMEESDADALDKLRYDSDVKKYIPTFLYEYKYKDARTVISKMKEDCFDKKEQIILGVYLKNEGQKFLGLAEFYNYSEENHDVSLGVRLLKEYWGRGIAKQVINCMEDYLFNETDVEIIKASILSANKASAKVAEKKGYTLVEQGILEDWGFEEPKVTDKWVLSKENYKNCTVCQ